MELFFISKDTTIANTVEWITALALKGIAHPECIEIAKICKESQDPLKTLFDIAYKGIVYVPDEIATQTLRTMNNIITHGEGNCVHYTTLISAVLILLRKPHYRKVVSYNDPNIYEHIYIECDGIILDPVLGQKQDGTDKDCRPLEGQFNSEKPYKYKQLYYMPKLQVLNGTNGVNTVTPIIIESRTKAIRQRSYYGTLGCNSSALGCGLGCSCLAVKK